MATKKTASKPTKKAAAKKPAQKAVVKKTVAKKTAKKPAAKKTALASKAKVASKPAKKETKKVKKTTVKPAAKKAVAKKPAPKPKAKAVTKPTPKPTKKAAVQKPVAKAATKPVHAPVKKAAPAKTAPKPTAAAKPEKKKKAAPEPKTRKRRATAQEPKAPAKPLVTQGAGPNMPRVTPMVKKIVSTLEAGDKDRYSDSELEEFRAIIRAKLEEARKDYALLKQTLANTDNNGTEDTSPSFKMIEDGSETLGREETAQLAGRQEKFIKHLEDAMLRIRNKTYGICRVTGKLISKERLRLVPHATLSIEAKQQMSN